MQNSEIALRSPGVTFADSILDSVAKRCNPQSKTPKEVDDRFRREANNYSRFITWAVVPLACGEEKHQFEEIAASLRAFGLGHESTEDYPEVCDPTALLLDRWEEFQMRVIQRVEELALGRGKKGGAR